MKKSLNLSFTPEGDRPEDRTLFVKDNLVEQQYYSSSCWNVEVILLSTRIIIGSRKTELPHSRPLVTPPPD